MRRNVDGGRYGRHWASGKDISRSDTSVPVGNEFQDLGGEVTGLGSDSDPCTEDERAGTGRYRKLTQPRKDEESEHDVPDGPWKLLPGLR